MKIIKVADKSGFYCQSYILTADEKNAVLIDCASKKVLDKCASLGYIPRVVLLTHGHFDHIRGCAEAQRRGAKIYNTIEERVIIEDQTMPHDFNIFDVERFTTDEYFKDGQMLELYGMTFKIIATPGHSVGSVSIIVENKLFTGDTLFCLMVGRTDLFTSDEQALQDSLKKLCELPGDYVVMPGHGQYSTLEQERRLNPYIKG